MSPRRLRRWEPGHGSQRFAESDVDPLGGLANLADLMLVFACGLMVSLAAHGCHKVSLTVTSANTHAAALYRRMGFTPRREFAAYVWQR